MDRIGINCGDSATNVLGICIDESLTWKKLAWGNANSAVLNKTIKLQKRAIRIINNAGYNSHTDPLFKISGILKVQDLYYINIKLPCLCSIILTTDCQYHSIRPSNLIIKYKTSVQRDNQIYFILQDVTQILLEISHCMCFHKYGTSGMFWFPNDYLDRR